MSFLRNSTKDVVFVRRGSEKEKGEIVIKHIIKNLFPTKHNNFLKRNVLTKKLNKTHYKYLYKNKNCHKIYIYILTYCK